MRSLLQPWAKQLPAARLKWGCMVRGAFREDWQRNATNAVFDACPWPCVVSVHSANGLSTMLNGRGEQGFVSVPRSFRA